LTLNARIHFKSKFTDICVQNSINSGDSNNKCYKQQLEAATTTPTNQPTNQPTNDNNNKSACIE